MALRRSLRLFAAGLCAVAAAGLAVAGAADPSSAGAASTSTSTSTSTIAGSGISVGTGTGTGSSTTTTAPPNTPVVLADGGTVHVAVAALPTDLNPWTAAGSSQVTAEIAPLIWPSVFVTAPGGSPQPDPALVNAAEVVGVPPASSFTVEYQINPQAIWSDGTPITAADFVYLWQQLRHASGLGPSVPVAGYDDIASISSSNAGKTVTVVFTTPYASWPSLFADLVPAQLGKAAGFSAAFAEGAAAASVSGGPFVVSSVVPGRQLVLTRNARYWAGAARLSRIVFTVVRGESQVIRDLELGTIDLAEVTPNAAVASDVAASGHLVEQVAASPRLWQLVYNLADPLLAHQTMRRAVTDLIDRSELLWNTVGLETGQPVRGATHLFQSGYPGSVGHDGAYLQSDDGAAYGLLAAAGYTRDSAGVVTTPAGTPLVLHLLAPRANLLAAETVSVVTAQLGAAGVTVQATYVPLRQLLRDDLPTGSFQIALAPYELSPQASQNVRLYSAPVGPLVSPFVPTGQAPVLAPLSAPADPAGETEPGAALSGVVSRDVAGYSDATVTALAGQAFIELNPAKAVADYNRIDSLLWGDLPTVPLFQTPVALITRDDLVNVEYAEDPAGPFWNAEQWGIQVSPQPAPPTTTP